MAERKLKSCNCVEKVNEQLSAQGMKLETAMSINFKTGKAIMEGPFLSSQWVGKPKRGKRLPLMTCTYCPICGKKK